MASGGPFAASGRSAAASSRSAVSGMPFVASGSVRQRPGASAKTDSSNDWFKGF